MRKWMVEFLRIFKDRSIKISRVNYILITKSIDLQLFTLILNGFGVSCDLRRFSVLSPFIEKSMVQYIQANLYNCTYDEYSLHIRPRELYL